VLYIYVLPAIMKPLQLIALLLFALASCDDSQNNKLNEKEATKSIDPFSTIDFDKVIAYDFAGNTEISLLDSSGQLTKTVTNQIILNKTQLTEFKEIIMDSTTFGELQPKDFYPHLGIVFYKNNKILQSLEVSLICSGMFATFPIQELDKRKYPDNGLTEKGRVKIYNFCKELGFNQYLGSKKYFEYQPTQ
jgi:hypothetical protein